MSTTTLPLRASPTDTLPRPDAATLAARLFVAWLVARTLLWTGIAWAQPNPPLDVVEWVTWGRDWQLGYHKHPPLAAWVADVAYRATPGSFLGVYVAGYLAVAAALVCVWRLASRLLPPRPALAAVLCLDGLVYLGPVPAEFNNQVLLLAFWALAVERFHAAVTRDRWADWALTGLALGLALLCKYSAVFLIAPLLAWWLWHAGGRRWTRPVVVAIVAAVVFLPHCVWLVQHDFPTLRYAADRTRGDGDALDPRLSGILFVLSQGARLLPVLLILLPLLRRQWRALPRELEASRSLVVTAVVGPVALHLVASLVFGLHLRDIWGVPLWTFAGLLVVLCVKTADAAPAWRRARLVWAVVLTLLAGWTLLGNLAGSTLRARPMRVHYPGALLAREVTQRYQQCHGEPPAIIAGDWWLAGNVGCHAAHRPVVYGSREPAYVGLDLTRDKGDPRRFLAPEPAISPWADDAALEGRGGVLLWDARVYGEDVPPWVQERFPTARGQRVLVVPVLGGGGEVRVGWAMLAPLTTGTARSLSGTRPTSALPAR